MSEKGEDNFPDQELNASGPGETTHADGTSPSKEQQHATSDALAPPKLGVRRRALRRASLDATPYDVSYRPSLLRLYSRPQQRQKWGETQVLPRVNWGDLFFDLFYVGATFNVSTILVAEPTGRGLLYAMATFFGVLSMWNEKTLFDCRFVYQSEDVYHRLLELSLLLILALAVLNIRPTNGFVHRSRIFIFCLALVLERSLNLVRYLEVYLFGVGEKIQLRTTAKHNARNTFLSLSFNVAATVIAWNQFQDSSHIGSGNRLMAETGASSNGDTSTDNTAKDDLPIILVLTGFLVQHMVQNFLVIFFVPKDGRHKQFIVPLNVGFTVHRNGEWVMLMLGESIFSILVVYLPEQSGSFYTIFYCGLLMIILLQYLHFLSLPRDSINHHALRRSKEAGILWLNLHIIYSFSLVALGAAFTNFLMDETYEQVDSARLLAETTTFDDPDLLRQQNAYLFAGSLAAIFLCLDATIVAHMGWGESKGRCVCPETKKKNVKGIGLIVLRGGLIAFVASLGFWIMDPATLTVIGLACVMVQVLFRRLGLRYLSREYDDPDDGDSQDSARWPNVTTPQTEHHHH